MRESLEDRSVVLARYVIENKATVRVTAKKFGISKSTVHNDLTQRLKVSNKALYNEVKSILNFNKSQRHIRGGLATQKKWHTCAPTVSTEHRLME